MLARPCSEFKYNERIVSLNQRISRRPSIIMTTAPFDSLFPMICQSQTQRWSGWALIVAGLLCLPSLGAGEPRPVTYTSQLQTVLKQYDHKFQWFHPRAVAVPSDRPNDPMMVMTLQKHLMTSDYFSGLHVMTRRSLSAAWTGPVLPPQLDWQPQPDGVTVSVADVTPGWHAPTGKVIALGCQVRYNAKGEQLNDVRRAHQTVYAILDPHAESWTRWQVLTLPPDEQFDFARNACAQWLVQPDGHLLVPLYIARNAQEPFSVTVAECRFDGTKLTYIRHGNVLRLNVVRGLNEPSLIFFKQRYFLTLRNDVRGYVSVSNDGLQFDEPQPWCFDDGVELGSYNTQQHWLTHGDGLFLIYTRRGANNDHIVRNRAPLFMAQVDPTTLRVMRRTEKIIVPERGAELGNFGANAVSATESWVTVSEGMFMKDSVQRGAEGATFIARILWDQP